MIAGDTRTREGLVDSAAEQHPPEPRCLVTCADLYYFKFSIAELVAVITLFFASLANVIVTSAVIDLSIFILVMSFVLLMLDVRFLARTRDFRRVVLVLFSLECVIFVSSAIVLAFWVNYSKSSNDGATTTGGAGRDRGGSLAVFYTLDAIMLVAAIGVTVGRLVVRARDRHALQKQQQHHQGIEEGIAV